MAMSLVGLDLALISGLDERQMFLTVETRPEPAFMSAARADDVG